MKSQNPKNREKAKKTRIKKDSASEMVFPLDKK